MYLLWDFALLGLSWKRHTCRSGPNPERQVQFVRYHMPANLGVFDKAATKRLAIRPAYGGEGDYLVGVWAT